MLACLYGLPVLLSGYSISTREGYYTDNCFATVASHLNINQTYTAPNSINSPNSAGSQWCAVEPFPVVGKARREG